MTKLVLVIDSGTTNTKVALVNSDLNIVWEQSIVNKKTHPQPGWVEQDPLELRDNAQKLLRRALSHNQAQIVGIGITNQRETIVLWDKKTHQPIYPAIVWEDKRTTDICRKLAQDQQLVDYIRGQTGLMLNPYFSATKLSWLLKHLVLSPKDLASIAFGTIDSWLVYCLTGCHLTDYTNASRTLLFNTRTRRWDPRLLTTFGIPRAILPQVLPSRADYGKAKIGQNLNIPIKAVMGDQQASLYAAGDKVGTVKITYGTGIFPMRLIGSKFELKDGYFTTLAVGDSKQPVYAWEGKVENAAARTSSVLDDPTKLKQVVKQLAKETDSVLKPLLKGTQQVWVDGGISQNDTLVAEQARLASVKVNRLPTREGTILGVAKSLWDL